MSNELAIIEKLELVPFFTKGDSVEETLAAIEREALAFVGDVSTLKGRKEILAMVTKVTKSKTYLEANGKDLAAEYKAIPKAIDATRKRTKDFLTELQAKVRLPLTEWEIEQQRIADEESARIEAEQLSIKVEADHEMGLLMNSEFDRQKEIEQQEAIERQRKHDERVAAEATRKAEDAAKLAAIRAEEEARARIDAAELAAKRASEQAELDRKAAMQAEIDAEQAEQRRVEQEKQSVIRAKADEEARIKWEADQKAQREAEAIAADERQKQAEVHAAEQARLKEVARVEAENAAAKADEDRRLANRAHIGKVRKQAKEFFMANGVSEDVARELVIKLSKSECSVIAIKY